MHTLKPETRERIQQMTLMDDLFMRFCFKDEPAAAELLLHIILGRTDLWVQSLKTEDEIVNLQTHGVTLDIHAVDAGGIHYDIEIQSDNQGAIPKRARYYASMLDISTLPKGATYDQLAESYVIFITDKDYLGDNLPLYHVDRSVQENHKPFQDKSHIIYVNGEYRGDDALGRLVHDFQTKNLDDYYYPELKKIAAKGKVAPEGEMNMLGCVVEEYAAEVAEKATKEATYAERNRMADTMVISMRADGKKDTEIILVLSKYCGFTQEEATNKVMGTPA